MAVTRVLDRVGQVLGGRFRLLAPIGTGASASVYVAEDVVLRRRVAVKVLHAALADDEAFLRRFRAEAHAAAALNHPHIVAIYDWGQDADADAEAAPGRGGGHGIPFLVTEYLGGGSLRAMLDASGPLTPAQALLVGLEAARGLEYAHRRGFVHRDIKPANLLFDDEARLRIADFGLARALAEAAWTEPMGAVLGTARYASPEQARGESLDGKSDVYSLALVIVEAVTGAVPFAADTTIGTLMARVNQPLRVPDELVALRQPLEWAGVPDPAMRPDAAEFGAALMAAAVDFDRPPPLILAGAHIDGEALALLFDPTEHGEPAHLQTGLDPVLPEALDRPAGGDDGADLIIPGLDTAGAHTVAGSAATAVATEPDVPGDDGGPATLPVASGEDSGEDSVVGADVGAALAGSALEAAVAAGHTAGAMTTATSPAPDDLSGPLDGRVEDQETSVLDASGQPFGSADPVAPANGQDHGRANDTGSFLVAGPDWDPAHDRATGVPVESPTVAGYGPTAEQPLPGPGRPRRGLGRVLPLTAGPDPDVAAGVTSAVPLVAADTTVVAPPVGPEGRWGSMPTAPPTAPHSGYEPTIAVGGPRPWAAAPTSSPYDSVTTEYADLDRDAGAGYDGDGYDDRYDDDPYGDQAVPLTRRDRRSAQRIAEAEAKADRLVARAERRQHRRRRWPAVLVVLLLLTGAAGGYAYWWFEVRVPSHPVPVLVGKNVAELDGLIGDYGWTVAQEQQFDDAAPAGQILSQRPGPNVEVLRGGTVSIVVSKGLPPVDVPATVVGQTREEATATLNRAGLGVGAIETRFDEKVPPNVVIALAPGTPAQVLKGTDIGLVVSSGPEPRTIPDGLVGKPADKAVAALEALGLKASTTEEFSDAISKGNVISVDPGVGKQAARGSTVAVVVSKGPPTVAIPKVEGQSVADATGTLEEAGLVVSGIEGSPRKKVIGTDPAIGTTVRKGSKVTLITEADAVPKDPKATTTTTAKDR